MDTTIDLIKSIIIYGGKYFSYFYIDHNRNYIVHIIMIYLHIIIHALLRKRVNIT